MGWNYYSIPNLQRYNRWSLGIDKQFHLTLYWACYYLSMMGLKLNHVSKTALDVWAEYFIGQSIALWTTDLVTIKIPNYFHQRISINHLLGPAGILCQLDHQEQTSVNFFYQNTNIWIFSVKEMHLKMPWSTKKWVICTSLIVLTFRKYKTCI